MAAEACFLECLALWTHSGSILGAEDNAWQVTWKAVVSYAVVGKSVLPSLSTPALHRAPIPHFTLTLCRQHSLPCVPEKACRSESRSAWASPHPLPLLTSFSLHHRKWSDFRQSLPELGDSSPMASCDVDRIHYQGSAWAGSREQVGLCGGGVHVWCIRRGRMSSLGQWLPPCSLALMCT